MLADNEMFLVQVDLPIHFTDSSTEVVTFRGEGLLAGRDSPKSQNDTDGVQIITTITQPGQVQHIHVRAGSSVCQH